jgi:hypothetical protein
MFLAGFAAITAGVFVFKNLEPGWLTICLGMVMTGIVVLDHYQVMDRLAGKIDLRSTATAFGLSSAAGLIAGIAGGGGMYLYSIYLKYACPTPTVLRGTSILLGAIFIFWRLIAAAAMGLISPRLLVEGLVLVPPSLIGAWAGIHFFRRADSKRFYGALSYERDDARSEAPFIIFNPCGKPLAQIPKHLVRVALGIGHFIGFKHPTVRPNQCGNPYWLFLIGAFGRAISHGNRAIGIIQVVGDETRLLGPRFQVLGWTEGYAEHYGILVFEVLGSITEPIGLFRSIAAKGTRVEPDQHVVSRIIRKADAFPILIG